MSEEINIAATDKEHLLQLINNMDDPLWLINTNSTIIECNRSFKKWVSYFIGKELDKGDCVLYNGQDEPYRLKFEMCYQLALSGKSFKSVEDMMVDGQKQYTRVSFNPVFDDDGRVIAVSCYARDITEQRMHLQKIEEQNTALREIAFIESHKVRRPVATILGLGELFNQHDPTDPMNTEILQGMIRMAHELDLIIREVVKKSNAIGI